MSLPNIEYWNNIFPPLEPFYTAQTDDYTPLPRDAVSQAAMNGQNWHLNMLKLVGSWVAKGNTDERNSHSCREPYFARLYSRANMAGRSANDRWRAQKKLCTSK